MMRAHKRGPGNDHGVGGSRGVMKAFMAYAYGAANPRGDERYRRRDEEVTWRRLWPKRGELIEVDAGGGNGAAWTRATVARRLFASGEFDAGASVTASSSEPLHPRAEGMGDGHGDGVGSGLGHGRYRLIEEGVDWRRVESGGADDDVGVEREERTSAQ